MSCNKYFSDEAGKTEISIEDTVVAATGHSLTKVDAKAVTCTEAGNTAYYVCSVCDKYFSDEAGKTEISLADTVVAATGHSLTKVDAKAATCTEAGNTAYYVCSVCDKYFSDENGETEISAEDTVIPASHSSVTEIAITEPTTETAGAVNEVCSVCKEVISQIATLPELTQENFENGTYNYSVIYKLADTGDQFNRYGVYSYADTTIADIPSFEVDLNSKISADNNNVVISGEEGYTGTFTAQYLSRNSSFDSAQYGILLTGLTTGWYKFTVNTTSADLTATVIGSDGTIKDIITSSDNLEGLFSAEEGNTYMVVLHSSASRIPIRFTVAPATLPTISLTQTAKTGSLAGGNSSQGVAGGSVDILVADDVAEGTYKIKLVGSSLLGRNYYFTITVNGVEYNTSLEMVGGLGAAAVVELKGGDIVTIANDNLTAMDVTVTLTKA